MGISNEGRRVFKRFLLIGFGIPAVLLIFISVLYLSPWALARSSASNAMLNLAAVCLAFAGLLIWAFFSFLLYRRLWKAFPYIAEKEQGWSFAEGSFGLIGVGVSMASVLGIFYYLFTGDFKRGALITALSFILGFIEAARFPARIDEIEQITSGME
ncbi:MAG: hypothetical protein A2Y75_07155 [Candidatus Solincola sediminis]|uniref:Uncharacterized protein n=1 Tax=Candidatus Solincola sediminis TaxID=1797199 RepID=A0A1F2WJA4_9ACTN|nr:MAG: hypothetical protein A2Y75_07155 [Candidatus Solincola sediminis]